jgi:hypothetical protein
MRTVEENLAAIDPMTAQAAGPIEVGQSGTDLGCFEGAKKTRRRSFESETEGEMQILDLVSTGKREHDLEIAAVPSHPSPIPGTG